MALLPLQSHNRAVGKEGRPASSRSSRGSRCSS